MSAQEELTSIIFKIEPSLKQAFEEAVQARQSDTSKMLRFFIRSYVEEHKTEQEIKTQLAKKPVKRRR